MKNLPFALTNAITVHNNTNNLGYPAIWELNIPANITFIYFFIIIILFTLVSFGFIPALSCFWYEVVWSTVSVCVCVCLCVFVCVGGGGVSIPLFLEAGTLLYAVTAQASFTCTGTPSLFPFLPSIGEESNSFF